MTNALVTIIAPLNPSRISGAEKAIDHLGNPANTQIQTALDQLDGKAGTHFASMHAIRSADGSRSYLVLEFSADGTEDAALARIVGAIGNHLQTVFQLASDWRGGADLGNYLSAHRVTVGGGWFDNPGVIFAGTPGITVNRIQTEARLAARVSDLLATQQGHLDALNRVEAVRIELGKDPLYAAELEPATSEAPFEPPSKFAFGVQLLLSFVRTYLWPVGVVLLLSVILWGVYKAWPEPDFVAQLRAFGTGALRALRIGFWIALLLVAALIGATYVLLRRAERRDSLEEHAPDRAINAAMFAHENRGAQNHMISVTQRKPGAVRWFTARLVFWIIGEFATRYYRPGFLSDIGTIHFARWVTAPGSPDLIFLSNYDGSWESYLEDFITRAHAGLTGIWSNSIGFPRSENLFQKGATDGERFKRYARHSMVPTRFWYSAYPGLTTTVIRTNTQIRRGLSGIKTDDEAMHWLALFGSAVRPASKLVSNEIQSLMFGGLGFMPFGTCLILDLPENSERARQWLKTMMPHIAFNDGRRLRVPAVVTLALGARGLARLGLAAESLATFPFTFQEGMTTEARARILGDHGENGPTNWRWGQTQPDVALLVYGESDEAVKGLADGLVTLGRGLGMAAPHSIPLKPVAKDKREPFGFVDGISQPVIRGTYKGLRSADPIHLVEPGEFILGYPDNRGNLPPGPTLPAAEDPENRLPLVDAGNDFGRTVVGNPRDVGFNGSFLVIRELEQDTEGFNAYCRAEADHLRRADRLSEPYVVTEEFIAAKMVGRWRDGSSLVRHPYEPKLKEQARAEARLQLSHAVAASDGGGGDKHETARPTTHPADAPSIERAPPPSFRPDNDFLFGTEDPEALRCPFGAHIRRANPRDSLDPGSADQIAISNRHRIIRVGRQFIPKEGGNPGLLFMCLNGDIERQFEFLQQTWLNSPSFHGLSCEKDPLLGDGEVGVCSYTVPTREGPVRLPPMPRFVTTKGGGYFFLPGKRLIEYLSAPD